MSAVFLKVLNMSITASWLLLAAVIIRFLLKKAPKWISCLLWAIVAIRLICPLSIESALSLIPSSEPVPQDIELSEELRSYGIFSENTVKDIKNAKEKDDLQL